MRNIIQCLITAFWIFLLLSPLLLSAQLEKQVRFTNFNNIEGFPSQEVFSMTKDKYGFFWISSTDGLYRIDAVNSSICYRKDNPVISGGIQSSDIKALCSDIKDNLWIGTTLGGLTKFHQSSGLWKTYTHDPQVPTSISNNDILEIVEDSKGRIWIGTEDGLNLYNPLEDNFTRFVNRQGDSTSINSKAVISILEDKEHRIWATTWAGGINLLIPDKKGNIADSHFRHFYPSSNKASKNVWKLYQDHKNRIWVGTVGDGLYLMDSPPIGSYDIGYQAWTPTFHKVMDENTRSSNLSSNVIFDILEDSNGYLWISTNNGLNRTLINTFNHTSIIGKEIPQNFSLDFEKFYSDLGSSKSINSEKIYKLYEDEQQLIWFGTSNGLSQYSWYSNQFQNYKIKNSSEQKRTFLDIYAHDENNIFISTEHEGLLKYDIKSNELHRIETDNQLTLLKDPLHCLYSKNKKLYVGTSKGIEIVDLQTYQSKSFILPDKLLKEVPYLKVTSILKDHLNQIWLGSTAGLFKFDEKTGEYESFFHDPKNPSSVCNNSITGLLEDQKGYLWVSTYNGLNRVNLNNPGKVFFTRYKHDPDNIDNSIPNNQLSGIVELDDHIYFGSRRGIFSFNQNTQKFIDINELENKYRVVSLEISLDKNIWGSTMNGLFVFNPTNNSFQFYDSQEDLGGLVYSTGASSIDKNGYLYFCGKAGLTKFMPTDIKKNEVAPPISITSVKKISPEKETINTNIDTNDIILNPDDYYLSINFTAQNFIQPRLNQYAYQLEGFDENWIYTNQNMSAVYTNLKPGNYSFKVKGANNDNIWNNEGISLNIIKKPAIWETYWFRILSSLITILLIRFGFLTYTRNVRKHNYQLTSYNKNLNLEISERKKVEKELHKREQFMEQLTKDLQKYNEELKRSNQDLEQFAYIASHDLQSPLRTIKSFSDLLEKNLGDELKSREKDFLNFITGAVSNMQDLVDSLLTFSKVNAKRGKIETINPIQLIDSIKMELITTLAEKRAIIEYSNLPARILGDKIKLKQLFQNLITNAIKFTKKDMSPVITISCIEQERFWEFSVTDNGIGIQKEFQSKVFLLFQRLHTTKDYEGTGIGLALCKKIVEQHGGKIKIDSEINIGSSFIFTINKILEQNEKKYELQETDQNY